MPTFTEADRIYRALIEGPGRELGAAFSAARSVADIDMNGTDISHAVILRLKAFMICQEQIKSELGKVYAAPAADFFVETVSFFLKVVIENIDPLLSIASEKNIVRRQGSMRPDISIWKEDEVIAAIECKTQLGWNRDGWLHDFEKRETRLAAEFPNARLFLLVMTGSNWPGFGDDKRVDKQFFVLLNNIWPNTFDTATAARTITHPIEGLFREVLSHAKNHPLRQSDQRADFLRPSTYDARLPQTLNLDNYHTMPEIIITEPALLIRTSRLFNEGMASEDLYEITRGVWKIGSNREKAEYAFCVAKSIVREIYKIQKWQPAGTTPYETIAMMEANIMDGRWDGRWEFVGKVAPETIREKYIGKSVGHYFKKGNANPVNYLNI